MLQILFTLGSPNTDKLACEQWQMKFLTCYFVLTVLVIMSHEVHASLNYVSVWQTLRIEAYVIWLNIVIFLWFEL